METRFRKLTLACVAAAALAAGIAPAQAFEREGSSRILVLAARQPVPVLDPSIKYDASIRTLQQALYDGLVKYEGTPPKVVPWLAESWETSADGKTWTFHLAKTAKFHNGDPVTAEAVKYSFLRTLKLNQGPAWMLSEFLKPEGITVVDPYTIRFELTQVYAPFLSFLPWWYVMNPAEIAAHEENGDMGQKWLTEHAAGSGPFKLKRFEQGTLYEVERVKDYWKGFPYQDDAFGGVIYKLMREPAAQSAALTKGEADIVVDLPPDTFDKVSKQKGVATSVEPALTSYGFKFNTKGKYTSDINLRKAMAYAFDYTALLQVYNGRAKLETSPFTDDIRGKVDVPEMPRQDLAKAKDFMAKSAWPKGGIELEYVYIQGFEEERKMGLILLDAMKPLGIDIKMVPLTWPNMVARAGKPETSPDIMAVFATPVSTDPDAVAIQYHPDSWGKYYGSHFLDDPELAKLIETARKTVNWEERAPIYAEIQKRIVANQPEIFGMMRDRAVVYRDYVKGYAYSPVRMTTETDLYPLHIGK
ncbi:ABC transporter, substrate binding protein (Dipeptide) [uncultured Alphaproteobacteria bacterium]|uniref:ABC transporter, substrate binding protein (Dipeptide) n=1 Tax=uncultured Alphaproteobacteria bacterium TaxID=91750 RepID=A0A212JI69_9PROT|nr:ABC transporter, substrate binding protein (Dipeptide) [uncultured Alphaproteobacteria bacterium]